MPRDDLTTDLLDNSMDFEDIFGKSYLNSSSHHKKTGSSKSTYCGESSYEASDTESVRSSKSRKSRRVKSYGSSRLKSSSELSSSLHHGSSISHSSLDAEEEDERMMPSKQSQQKLDIERLRSSKSRRDRRVKSCGSSRLKSSTETLSANVGDKNRSRHDRTEKTDDGMDLSRRSRCGRESRRKLEKERSISSKDSTDKKRSERKEKGSDRRTLGSSSHHRRRSERTKSRHGNSKDKKKDADNETRSERAPRPPKRTKSAREKIVQAVKDKEHQPKTKTKRSSRKTLDQVVRKPKTLREPSLTSGSSAKSRQKQMVRGPSNITSSESGSDDDDTASVIQFDPLQDNNVYLAAQHKSFVDVEVGNFDGSMSMASIAGLVDPLGESQQYQETKKNPVFSFLDDLDDGLLAKKGEERNARVSSARTSAKNGVVKGNCVEDFSLSDASESGEQLYFSNPIGFESPQKSKFPTSRCRNDRSPASEKSPPMNNKPHKKKYERKSQRKKNETESSPEIFDESEAESQASPRRRRVKRTKSNGQSKSPRKLDRPASTIAMSVTGSLIDSDEDESVVCLTESAEGPIRVGESFDFGLVNNSLTATAYDSEADDSPPRHKASKRNLGGLGKYFSRSRRNMDDTNYDSDASSVCSSASKRSLFRLSNKQHTLLGDD